MQLFLAYYLIFFQYDVATDDREVMASSYSDMIAKLIFVNISHLMMQPEVEASLARLRFIITHPRNFNQFLVPLFMTFIDIIVTFFAEWITGRHRRNFFDRFNNSFGNWNNGRCIKYCISC